MSHSPHTNPLRDALESLRSHPNAAWLLSELWERDSPVRRLLMCHWESLFPSLREMLEAEVGGLGGIRFSFFVSHSSLVPETAAIPEPDEAATAEQEEDDDIVSQLVDEEDVRHLLLHFFILVAKDNPSIRELIDDPGYTFQKMLSKTRGTHGLDLSSIEREFEEAVAGPGAPSLLPSPDESPALRRVKMTLHDMIENFTTDREGIGQTFVFLSGYMGLVYEVTKQWFRKYLERIGIPLKTYQDAIWALLEHGLLEDYGQAWVCTTCGPEQVVTPGVGSSFHVLEWEWNCPKCGSRMEWCTLVRVADELYAALRYRDGIMALAIAQKLDELGVTWQSPGEQPGYSTDIMMAASGQLAAAELKMLWKPEHPKPPGVFKEGVDQVTAYKARVGATKALVVHNCPGIAQYDEVLGDGRDTVRIIPYLDLPAFVDGIFRA